MKFTSFVRLFVGLMFVGLATTAFGQAAPVSATTVIGKQVTFAVTLAGTPPFTYQWGKLVGGVLTPIAGATSASYVIASAVQADSGTYQVLVSNSAGSTTSNNGVLTVNAIAPTVLTFTITVV
jgi:hypothetical protein